MMWTGRVDPALSIRFGPPGPLTKESHLMVTNPTGPPGQAHPIGPQDAPNLAASAYRCPKCGGTMRSYERNGITIEQCTECRGIFLDRGELESLMAAEAAAYADPRAGQATPAQPAQPGQQSYPAQGYPPAGYPGDRGGGHHDRGRYDGGHQGKRRRGFLGELFD